MVLTRHSLSHLFSEIVVRAEIVCLDLQVYVWVGSGSSPALPLALAFPGLQGGPAAASILIRGPGDSSSAALSQRLSQRFERPVLCSCCLPADLYSSQGVVERWVADEIQRLCL
ncbi:hypothetical protein WJX74_004203 [Apatococcus lobatus]|uniref:Uncharacterized protein n=1 Tax=Apatococcus lobatus TaxID=904363 RepID=A0AAW1RP52_9CHLO